MTQSTQTIVLFALLAIIPALIVAVVIFLRQEAQRGDVKECERKLLHFISDISSKINLVKELENKVVVADSESQGIRLRMTNFEESFTALSNKWNSRERAERQAEKKATKRKEEDEEDLDGFQEIPGTKQQTLPFFPLQQQQPNQAPPAKKRDFGMMP